MKAFRKLLVPVDFSVHSAEAIRVASELAKRFEGSLKLIHVHDPMVYSLPDGFVFLPQHQLDELFEALETELASSEKLALEAGAPRVETALLKGVIAGEIVDHATRGEFDLIVMGTHGRTGMKHLVIGSIAERVVRLSACPVLTVKSLATSKQ